MDALFNALGAFTIPVAVSFLVLVLLLVVAKLIKNNYIKVPPNEVAVISGREHKMKVTGPDGTVQEVTVGYRLIKGGSAFVMPLFERRDSLDLSTINIPDLLVKDAITKEGVPLTVKAVANIKIGSEDTLLSNAVERLLGKSQGDILKLAYETLEGHLRAMLGTLTVEEVNSDRAAFSQKMISESQGDMAKLGLKIDGLTIKELSDNLGYLTALGQKRVAEVKRDAAIGAAEADRESTMKASTSKREGEVRSQENKAMEAEADKERQVKVAEYKGEAESATAKANQAGPLASAEARRQVAEKEQEVELARTKKATEVAEAEASRKAQELQATVVKPAEAQKEADIAKAEGQAKAVEIEAEASKKKLQLEGEGTAAALEAKFLAEAAGIKAKMLAEAEGILKKAEAYEKLDEAGKLLQILEAAQTLVPNSIKEFAEVMRAAASPLGNADKIVVVDGGGGSNNSHSALQRYAGIAPQMVFDLLQKAEGVGLDIKGLLSKAGVVVNGDSKLTDKPAGTELVTTE